MATFDDESFPHDAIRANGSIVGGPSFITTVVHSANGTEQRNGASGIHARRIFRLDTGTITNALRQIVLDFFVNRRGQSDSFRFLDPFDFEASGEPIVSGQLVKRYTAGAVSYDRPITKPRSGTITHSGGGTLDYSTGVISGGAGGTWSGEFEIQARFTGDRYTERNFFVDWHEVQLEIVETFDYDLPGSAGASLASTITYEFPLPLEVGRNRYGDYSTYVVQGGGYSEDRFAQYSGILYGLEGNVLCADRADLETLISAFLCVRGRRTAFQREGLNARFDRDALVIGYTGNESFQCPIGFVGIV